MWNELENFYPGKTPLPQPGEWYLSRKLGFVPIFKSIQATEFGVASYGLLDQADLIHPLIFVRTGLIRFEVPQKTLIFFLPERSAFLSFSVQSWEAGMFAKLVTKLDTST